jgi:hypothetical protein
MKRALTVFAVAGIVLCVSLIAGCKKRYFPKVTEEIIDPGVPVHQETVVE